MRDSRRGLGQGSSTVCAGDPLPNRTTDLPGSEVVKRALVCTIVRDDTPNLRPLKGESNSSDLESASGLPTQITMALDQFRLLTNVCLREAISTGKTALGSLNRFAVARAAELRLNAGTGRVAASIAVSLAKAHRTRLRHGIRTTVPFVRKPFLRLPDGAFHLDPNTGKVRFSLRRCEWVSFRIQLSGHHRTVLGDPRHSLKQLHVAQERAVLFYSKMVPKEYNPTCAVSLDTNESSLDGVFIRSARSYFVRILFPEIRRIQHAHFEKRRLFQSKKANDRRVKRRLLFEEGRRERCRVNSRLHNISRSLVRSLVKDRAALILENLEHLESRTNGSRRAPRLRRRLSSWPSRELHRMIIYKARESGVPIYRINPYLSSKTCPKCGGVSLPRSRAGPRFDCDRCGWSCDRQLNAGINLGKTALRIYTTLGGLRLDPDALSEDAVKFLYPACKFRPSKNRVDGGGGGLSEPCRSVSGGSNLSPKPFHSSHGRIRGSRPRNPS